MVKVAVYGINGLLGKPVIEGLLSEPFVSKISLPLKLVTSDPSKKPVEASDKVQYINYKDVPLKEAFKGVDVVINLSNPAFAPLQDVLDALIVNKVKLYIPSQFGTDLEATEADFPGFLNIKTAHSQAARDAGIKTVDIYTGLFIGGDQKFPGGSYLSVLNFDAEKKQVELIGDENTLVNPSFYSDIGKSVASISTFDDYSKLPNKLRIFSGRVTLGDLVAHYEKVNNVKLSTTKKSVESFVSEAKEKYKNFSFADFLLYLRTFVGQGEGKGVIFEKDNHRELVNPNESFFKWTKYTV